MKINNNIKESFSVIGKGGYTEKEGLWFIKKLWNDTNTHFTEVASLNSHQPKVGSNS